MCTAKVVTDWDEMEECLFSEKRWVDPKNIELENFDYKKGMFLRVWCNHDLGWCTAELGYEFCPIHCDHRDE